MDNEFSEDMKIALRKEKIQHHLVPPNCHRANAAERAIQTFKNHFKAGLATLDPNFSVREWDRLLPQTELTLNLLRSSRVNPNISAWVYIFGQFDYSRTPLALPGTKSVVHLKPNHRASWSPNGEEGWTVGPSLQHYRCINCYFSKTRSQRNCDTVTFFPTVILHPKINLEDYLRQAADDIISILINPTTHTTPNLELGDETKNALLNIAKNILS